MLGIIFLLKKSKGQIAVLVILIVLIVIYYFFDPTKSDWFLRCPLKVITGYECAGCGVQRSFHSLLHLRFLEAFRYNALFVLSILYFLFLIILKYSESFRSKKKLLNFFFSKKWLFFLIIIVLLFSLLKNTDCYKAFINNL
ncbi:DUF2752 domain-containing protein [Epilithonimonas hominis]|uniref:DUF2752 domain-containing protein n=1 Tax=Epilithonimonas hominis TaxID=420404 RepID=UPI0015A71378